MLPFITTYIALFTPVVTVTRIIGASVNWKQDIIATHLIFLLGIRIKLQFIGLISVNLLLEENSVVQVMDFCILLTTFYCSELTGVSLMQAEWCIFFSLPSLAYDKSPLLLAKFMHATCAFAEADIV